MTPEAMHRVRMLQEERDQLRAGLAAARAALMVAETVAANLRAERNALLAGAYAGPWQQVYTHAPATEKWERRHPRGHGIAELTAPSLILAPWSVSWRVVHAEHGEAHSVEEAKAAADAALLAAGWFLAEAVAP